MTMFMVLWSWPCSLWEFTRFIWRMQTEHRVAANPQTKPTDLGCESADKFLLPSTSTITIYYYYSPRKLIRPTEGGRLSQPRHCRKGAQPVPKTVYHSGCRGKHNWLRPLTLQSIVSHANEGSHRFTCHAHVCPQMEWAIPAFTPQPQSVTALWLILISHAAEGRRLSWPGGSVQYWAGLPARRWSPILVLAASTGNRTHHHWVASPVQYH